MSLPDRDNPYSFDAFLERLHSVDFYADYPPFQKLDKGSRLRARSWEELIVDVFRVYQETALKEVGPEPIIGPKHLSMPDIWR